jgi:hypothetical protein
MEDITKIIIDFIRSIGIEVVVAPIETVCVLPGIKISNGGLVIDPECLLYPGDLLHEAGHLAVAPPDIREHMNGALDPKQDFELAGELMAIPWSYAAAHYLGIDPAVVFHAGGYHGGSASLLENFAQSKFIGLPALQWAGLTYDMKRAKELGVAPFPKMIKWLRE